MVFEHHRLEELILKMVISLVVIYLYHNDNKVKLVFHYMVVA